MKIRVLFTSIIFATVVLGVYGQNGNVLVPAPGQYSEDIIVSFSRVPAGTEYRFTGLESPWLEINGPLYLTAVSGEERTYDFELRWLNDTGSTEEREYSYVIDKRPPKPPTVTVPSGYYTETQSVELSAEEGSIIYSLSTETTQGDWSRYSQINPLTVEPYEEYKNFTLKAYTVDKAGNRSKEIEWRYLFSREKSEKQSRFNIISPKEGNFYNPQLLYIDYAETEWVRYTTNGKDPTGGKNYTKPILIDKTGKVTLKIAASFGNSVIKKTITYNCQNRSVTGLSSGIVSNNITIPSVSELHYNFNDNPVDSDDPLLDESVTVQIQDGGIRPLVARLGDSESDWEYRYTFVLHGKEVRRPLVELFSKEGHRINSGKNEIVISEPFFLAVIPKDDNSTYFSISNPQGDTREYTSSQKDYPLPLSLEKLIHGIYTIRAKSIDKYGKESAFIEQKISVDIEEPAPPAVRLKPEEDTNKMTILIDNISGDEELLIVGGFELSNDFIGFSKAASDSFSVELPRGMAGNFSFQFAAKDLGGNMSTPSEPVSFFIDSLPPEKPNIDVDGTNVSIQADGAVFYSLNSNASNIKTEFLPVTEKITLKDIPGMHISYTIKAYSIDKNGNRSDIAKKTAVIDRRKPVMPDPIGVEEGGKYRENVSIQFQRTQRPIEIAYTYSTDGTEPDNPTLQSPRVNESVIFNGIDGRKLNHRVKFLPIINDTGIIGDIKEISFFIDQAPPELPEIEGITHNKSYAGDLLIELRPKGKLDTLYYIIGEPGRDITDPISEGTVYNAPIYITSPDNTEITYFLHIAVKDEVGNVTYSPRPTAFTIDKSIPDKPELSIFPKGMFQQDPLNSNVIIASRPLRIVFSSSGNGTILYALSSRPFTVTDELKQYHDPIIIEGTADKELVYYISAYTEDTVGNRSETLGPITFMIDRNTPETPPPPITSPVSGGLTLSWPKIKDRVYYRYAPEGEFKSYTAPVILPRSILNIEYYAEDQAGNRSQILSHKTAPARIPEPPVISGAVNENTYEGTVELTAEPVDGIVRYEIGTLQKPPGEVSSASPELKDALTVDAMPGETVTFIVRTKQYFANYSSSTATVTFTIDRTIPPPPLLVDRTESYDPYSPQKVFELTAPEGTPFVNVTKDLSTPDETFTPYTEPLVLEAEKGQVVTFTIQAYSQDKAGNKSDIITREVILDQEIIYVSTKGAESGTGTKNAPFKSLDKAIEYAFKKNRRNIYISEGIYNFSESISGSAPIIITGGFSSENWQSGSKTTILNISTKNEIPFQLTDNSFQFRDLNIRDSREENNYPIINSLRGDIKLENCTVTTVNPKFIDVSSGKLKIDNCTIQGEGIKESNLLRIAHGTLEITDSSLSLKAGNGSQKIITLTNSGDSVITNSSFSISGGEIITGIKINASGLKVNDSVMNIQGAAKSALAIDSRDARLDVTATNINISNSPVVTILLSYNGVINLVNSTLEATSDKNSTAIYARSGIVNIDNCSLYGRESSNSIYTIQCIGTMTSIKNSTIEGHGADDTIGVVLKQCYGEVKNNQITVSPGRNRIYGAQITGKGKLILSNNKILLPADKKEGIALFLDSPNKELTITGNSFSGWKYLLAATAQDSVVWKPEKAAVSISQIAALNSYTPPDETIALIIKDNKELSGKDN